MNKVNQPSPYSGDSKGYKITRRRKDFDGYGAPVFSFEEIVRRWRKYDPTSQHYHNLDNYELRAAVSEMRMHGSVNFRVTSIGTLIVEPQRTLPQSSAQLPGAAPSG